MDCPKCGGECWQDSVDVGVGVIHGPWGCPECYWSEREEYDKSNGPSLAQLENPGWHVDNFGRMTRISAIVERAERFGLGDAAREAFK